MDCTRISPECPIEETIYGYYPNLAANAAFAAFFGVFMIVNIFFGVRYRSWTFLIAMTGGCLGEAVGYVGRVLLNDNPFSEGGFNMQIICLTLAPAFIAAGIYLTLKHVVICFGEEHSYLKPRYYTWLFIFCDLVSLTLQGAGGGIAATTTNGSSEQAVGNDLMMAGFKLFLGGFLLAFVTMFIRCVYRIAEMAGGWGNSIMQSELDFIVLDSVMITISVLAMTIFHPGYCFPQMVSQAKRSRLSDIEKKTSSETSVEESSQPAKRSRFGRWRS
ncbi:hypothetical protein EPUS_01244 [Endocarpon pusillum Z07020]|uniref:Sphingoid long-chain base transporter RSB1 n=1 Tax=Endocarpon pusillum (strain Z07020 / HMAS-L-300199) TaxID=1263415 RepID=U1GTX3_ENDPU|nr:uncharacterized protein EPUS_01244 [Endocarpon pusillum Z07020]ERF75878.1 hypothetical protein EPUS_01244 [Endocarpon pusillum Z07020]